MAVLGLRGSGSFNVNGEEPQNWRDMILFLHPNPAPLTAFLSRVEDEPTTDPRYNWYEEVTPVQLVYASAQYTSGVTSIVVATTGSQSYTAPDLVIFKPGHVLLDTATQEQMLVTSFDGVSTLTVVRGYGSTAAATIASGDPLMIIGNAYAEGAGYAQSIQYQPTQPYNLTQIFKTSFSLTRTALKTYYRTGDPYTQSRIRALRDHSIEMEKAFLWGQRQSSTGSNGQTQRTTQGIVNFLSSNVVDFKNTVTEATWDQYMEQIFRFGSDEKLALAGGVALNVLNQLAKNKNTLNAVPGDETYGYKLKRYETPFGDLLLYKHPLLSQTGSPWQSHLIVIDMTRVKYRYVTETTLQENVQNPGDDQRIDQFLTECGLELHHEQTHAWFKNVSQFAA